MIKAFVSRLVAVVTFIIVYFGILGVTSYVSSSEDVRAVVVIVGLIASFIVASYFAEWVEAYFDGRGFRFRIRVLDTVDKRASFAVFLIGFVVIAVGVLFHPLPAERFLDWALHSPAQTLTWRRGIGPALIFWIGVGITILSTFGAAGLYGFVIRWIRDDK